MEGFAAEDYSVGERAHSIIMSMITFNYCPGPYVRPSESARCYPQRNRQRYHMCVLFFSINAKLI